MAKDVLNPIPVTEDFKDDAAEFRKFLDENGLSYPHTMRSLIKAFLEKNRGKRLHLDFDLSSVSLDESAVS